METTAATPSSKFSKQVNVCKTVLWFLWVVAMIGGAFFVVIAGFVNRIKPVSNPDDPRFQQVGKFYQINKAYFGFLLHLLGGSLALLIGPFQFLESIRTRLAKFHRVMGYIYAVSIVVSTVGSIWLLPFVVTGVLVNHFAFGLLALLWIFTLGMGMYYIRFARNMELHRQWMIRNMSLTFAAVTLRIYLFGIIACLIAGGKSFTEAFGMAYTVVGWLSWVPNLIIAEFYIIMVYRQGEDKQIAYDMPSPSATDAQQENSAEDEKKPILEHNRDESAPVNKEK